MKKYRRLLIFIIFFVLFFMLLVLAPLLRSLLVMSVWNYGQKRDSLLADAPLSLSIPGGLSTPEADWYPLLLTYNADADFQRWTGDSSLRLTILYNFPAYSLRTGCSRLYDIHSPYYSSFYGAYMVKDTDGGIYGFEETGNGAFSPLLSRIAEVPTFDYQQLVLGSFGLTPCEFRLDWQMTSLREGLSFAGHDGWFVLDAVMTVNGAAHNPRESSLSYLQYGRPLPDAATDFALTHLYGRIYGQYFPSLKLSVFFYVVTADPAVLNRCDEEILSQSELIVSPADLQCLDSSAFRLALGK